MKRIYLYIIFLLVLAFTALPFFASSQTQTDAAITTQINTTIRQQNLNRANLGDMFKTIVDSKWASTGTHTITNPTITGNWSLIGTQTIDKSSGGGYLLEMPLSQTGTTPNGVSTVGKYRHTLDESFTNSDGQKDAVYQFGYNQTGNGGRVNTNEASFHNAFENHYIGSGTAVNGDFEWHLESNSRTGVINRHLSFNIQKQTGFSTAFMQVDGFRLFPTGSGTGGTPYFFINPLGQTSIVGTSPRVFIQEPAGYGINISTASAGFHSIETFGFSTQNYLDIKAGRVTIGQDNGSRAPEQFPFTMLGTNVANSEAFRITNIGTHTGNRYAIRAEMDAGELINELKNTNSSNGAYSIVQTSGGRAGNYVATTTGNAEMGLANSTRAYYLVNDGADNKLKIVTGTTYGAKDIRFLTFDQGTGRVGVGAQTSPTEVLDVIGNVKFSGALMPNNTSGSAGQYLVSNGPGASPTWENPVVTNYTGVGASVGSFSQVIVFPAIANNTVATFAIDILGITPSTGASGYAAKYTVTFRKDNSGTWTQIGAITTAFAVSDAPYVFAAPTFSVSGSSLTCNINFTGALASRNYKLNATILTGQ